MSKVDSSQIKGIANEIKSILDAFEKCVTDNISCCDNISTKATTLAGYDGKKVAGSDSIIENTDINYVIHKWKKWSIKGTTQISSTCASLKTKLQEFENIYSDLLASELLDIEASADAIDGYIKNVQDSLKESSIGDDILAKQFGFLNGEAGGFSKIAYSEYDALNGNFISSDKILTQYWDSYVLKFISNGDGTYSVMKGDTVMGFVTAFTAATYLKQLSSVVNKDLGEIKDSVESFSDSSIVDERQDGDYGVREYANGNVYEYDVQGNGILTDKDGRILKVEGKWVSSDEFGEYTLSHDKNNSSFVYEYKDGKVVEVWEKSGLTKKITYADGTRVDYNYEDDKISTYYSDGKTEVQSFDGNEKAVRYPDGTVEGSENLLKVGMPNYDNSPSYGSEVEKNIGNVQSESIASEVVDTTKTVGEVDENVRFSVPIPDEIAAAANINKNDTHYGKWSDSKNFGYGQGQGPMQDAWRELGMPDDRNIACVNGRYFVAVAEAPDGYIAEGYTEPTATLFGNIGDKINVHLNTGEVIECYIADAKSTVDLRADGFGTPMDNGNGTEGTNIIEWESTGIVDDTGWNTGLDKGYAPEGERRVKILHIDNLGPGFDFNTNQFFSN